MNSVSRPTRAGRRARRVARSVGSEIQWCTERLRGGLAARLPVAGPGGHRPPCRVACRWTSMQSLKSSTSLLALLTLLLALTACEGAREKARARQEAARNPQVTISGEEAVLVPAWQPPSVEIPSGEEGKVLAEAKKALDEDRLFGGPRDAVPLLLELRARLPDDPEIAQTHARAVKQLVVEGDAALEDMDMDPDSLRRAHEIGEVARTAAGDDPAVRAFLSRVDGADQSVKLDVLGEREFAAGRLGGEKEGEGALAYFREAIRRRPGDARAAQGVAAVESTMIRNAEDAAARADFSESDRWLAIAAKVRPGAG